MPAFAAAPLLLPTLQPLRRFRRRALSAPDVTRSRLHSRIRGPPRASTAAASAASSASAAASAAAEDDGAASRDDHFIDQSGVVFVWAHPTAASVAYYALQALQHRGQGGAGIVSTSPAGPMHEHNGLGFVSEVLPPARASPDLLPGPAAIAHNRYSTSGEKSVRNVQPCRASFHNGHFAIAHNGNLSNASALRVEFEMRGRIFAKNSDTEVVLHHLATSGGSSGGVERRAADALVRVEGVLSILILTNRNLIAARDPPGIRPLVLGELPVENATRPALVFASESSVLDIVGASFVREIEPGEMIVVNQDGGLTNSFPFPTVRRRACVFEHIYFSKPSSVVFGRSVYRSRFRFCELLASTMPVPNADAVVPVPASGVPAALGYATKSGIPYQQSVIRSHYVGRTFIQPNQVACDIGVRLNLAPIPERF